MNTKGTKFLAVLAVLAMAFAGFAVIAEVQFNDAVDLADDPVAAVAGQYSYAEDTHTLTIESFDAVKEAAVTFTGTDIAISGLTDDAKIAELGFVVKKTIGAVTNYSSSVSCAFSTIVNDKATAAAATAAPVSVVLLKDADEENGIIMSGVDVTTKYVAVNFDLNGKTLTHTNAGGLVGVSSVNKFIYVNDNQILKITNGTIKSALTYANIATKDVDFALIQTYGPLTLGDGNSALTLDISGVKTAAENLAVGVLYTSATSVVNANVTIDAGKNVALYAVYGASNNAGWYQTANGGTDTKENSTTGVKVTVKNGATINGEIGAAYYTAGADYGLNTITTGADLTIDGGTFSGKVVENLPIYNNGDEVPAVAASEGAVKTKVSIAGGSFTDFSALNYFTANSTAKIVSGDKEIPKPTTDPVDIVDGDASETVIPVSGTVIYNVDDAITALPTAAITADVVFQAGAADEVEFDTLTVKDSGSVTFTNMASISGVVKTTDGTSTQTFELQNFQGTLTVTKGSIIINAQEWIAGDIVLDKDAVAKISGTVEGNVNVIYGGAAGGSAKVIIEAGDAKSLTIADGRSLTIGANIDVEINGKVIGEDVTDSKLDVKAAKSVVINSGAVIDTVKVDNTGKAVTIYSGADINASSFVAFEKIAGKDASTGTWSYKEGKLTLNNYNGTYNFKQIANEVTTIAADGVNVISYAPTTDFRLFGNISTIGSDEGSLTINVDASAIPADLIDDGSEVFFNDANININQIELTITITGSNAAWTEDVLEDSAFTGIHIENDNKTLSVYNSSITVNVLSSLGYDADNVKGICVEGVDSSIDMVSSELFVDAKGVGVEAQYIDIKSSTGPVNISAESWAITATEVTVQKTAMLVTGDVLSSLTISNESNVVIGGLLETLEFVVIDKQSTLKVEDLNVEELGIVEIDRAAEVTVTGTSNIMGGIGNLGKFNNKGTMYVSGWISNVDGTFTNDGSIVVIANTFDNLDDDNNEFAVADTAVTASKVKVKKITLTEVTPNIDGTADVKATLSFNKTDPDAFETEIPEESTKFTGTLSLSQLNGSYTLTLRNGNATVTVAFDATKTNSNQIGKDYTMTVSGSITLNKVAPATGTVLFDLEAIPADTAVSTHEIKTISVDTDAIMTVDGGEFVNNNAVTVYSGAYGAELPNVPFVATDATYSGPLAVGSENMYIAGTVNGDITAKGAVEIKGTLSGNLDANTVVVSGTTKDGNITAKGAVNVTGTVNGNITTDAGVDASGASAKVVGNIAAKAAVNVNNLEGNIEVTSKTADVNVTFKKMKGTITHNSIYNTDEPEPPATPTTATVTSTMAIDAESKGTTIILKGATDKAGATEGAPGYFVIDKNSDTAKTDKVVNIALTAGKLVVAETTNLMKGYALTIESGTTFEISDKNANFDVTGATLKVSSGATKNYEEGAAAPVNYGKVVYIMKFDVASGYTVYSNIAYALENADENSELTVGQSSVVDTNVVVGTGITVIVPDGITLTFDGRNVDMKDNAKILLQGTGKVIFNESLDNTDIPDRTENVYYAVSGNVEFDGNVIVFDKVRFAAAGATINGIAATETVASKLNLALAFNEGTATISKGIAVGNATLGNAAYHVLKADTTDTLFSATLVIAEGTTFEASALTDINGTAHLKAAGSTEIVADTLASKVTVNGTLNLANNTTINGIYDGAGEIVLTAGRSVTIYKGAAINADAPADDVAAIVTAKIVDTTDEKNGYQLTGVSAPAAGANLLISAAGGANLMTISGSFNNGTVVALTTAMLDGLTVEAGATFEADSAKLVSASSAKGILKVKTLDLNDKVLDYDATYADGAYTVYTYASNIDMTKVTDIVIDGAKFDAAQQALFGDVIDLSGKDVTFAVKEGTTLVLVQPMIIGTAPTSLGAGASLSGTIEIAADAYLIVYPDVDISGATITDDDALAAAKSVFDIEGTTYLTIYANGGDIDLAEVSAGITPEIKGYTFTRWEAYSAPGEAIPAGIFVGASNVTATLVAQKVVVKATFIEGVQYYCNGVLYDAVGIESKVTVGSIFTAKIVDYSKYQGTPLVNGQNAFEVTENVTLNVTGVSPVEPTPEPEPAGMSLTEILLIVLVVLIAIMVVIIALRLNRS